MVRNGVVTADSNCTAPGGLDGCTGQNEQSSGTKYNIFFIWAPTAFSVFGYQGTVQRHTRVPVVRQTARQSERGE